MPSALPALPATWPPGLPLHRPVDSQGSRALDRAAEALGVPSLVLMEHASVGVAAVAAKMAGQGGPIVVLCGPGNNGGDGYGAARFLASWGWAVRVLRVSPHPPTRGDPALEARWAPNAENAWADPDLVRRSLPGARVVVDAVFGVGLTRDLDGPYPAWITAVNAGPAWRLAVDVPSGLCADTGVLRPIAVRADVTATMAAPKIGFSRTPEARAHVGRVIEIDIGHPREVHAPLWATPV